MRLSDFRSSTLACLGKADVHRLDRILLDLTRAENLVFWRPFFLCALGRKDGVK